MIVPDSHVLYCDNHLLCINKPPGMLTQGDRTGDLDLLTWARRYVEVRFKKPGRAYVGLVHRLDRPVSGVIVFARTSKSAARLSKQFRDRDVTKKYVAIVQGVPARTGTLKGRIRKSGSRMVVGSEHDAEGQIAELRYRVLVSGDDRSLVEVELQTGRKHQIRVQLAGDGYPILGDLRYGASTSLDGKNIALHCYHLAVDHPTRNERIGWTAGVPESWSVIWPRATSSVAELIARSSG